MQGWGLELALGFRYCKVLEQEIERAGRESKHTFSQHVCAPGWPHSRGSLPVTGLHSQIFSQLRAPWVELPLTHLASWHRSQV